jgi:hypothetical protein
MTQDNMTQSQNVQDPFFAEPSDTDDDEHENLIGLAIIKAHIFSQEYNPTTGRAEDKPNYHALKEGFTAGFLAGFEYKFTGEE